MASFPLTNSFARHRAWVDPMATQLRYPKHLVERVKRVLIGVCYVLETQRPKDLREYYGLTQAATREILKLEEDFYDYDCRLRWLEKRAILDDLMFISDCYGFSQAEPERLMSVEH